MLPYILSFLYKDVKTNRHFCTKKKQSSAKKGISTSKLHAYGPMGVQELTTTKFVVFGQGQVRK